MSTWQWVVAILLGLLVLSAWSMTSLLSRMISLLTRIDELLVQVSGHTGTAGDALASIDTRDRWLHGDPSQEALDAMEEDEDLG